MLPSKLREREATGMDVGVSAKATQHVSASHLACMLIGAKMVQNFLFQKAKLVQGGNACFPSSSRQKNMQDLNVEFSHFPHSQMQKLTMKVECVSLERFFPATCNKQYLRLWLFSQMDVTVTVTGYWGASPGQRHSSRAPFRRNGWNHQDCLMLQVSGYFRSPTSRLLFQSLFWATYKRPRKARPRCPGAQVLKLAAVAVTVTVTGDSFTVGLPRARDRAPGCHSAKRYFSENFSIFSAIFAPLASDCV